LKLTEEQSLELVRLSCAALEEKKAGQLRVIDVTGLSSITNYLVIATATSEPHVRALRVELEKALDSAQTHIVGVDTTSESGWAVMDAFDVMIHIFTPEARAKYRLEHLWRDGDDIPVERILNGTAGKAERDKATAEALAKKMTTKKKTTKPKKISAVKKPKVAKKTAVKKAKKKA
jgi:ribosome-associated protein